MHTNLQLFRFVADVLDNMYSREVRYIYAPPSWGKTYIAAKFTHLGCAAVAPTKRQAEFIVEQGAISQLVMSEDEINKNGVKNGLDVDGFILDAGDDYENLEEVIAMILNAYPNTKILVLTGAYDLERIFKTYCEVCNELKK